MRVNVIHSVFMRCGWHNHDMDTPTPRHRAFALWLIIAGVIGLIAAFALTVEKFHLLINPHESLGCDISPLVQCSANLDSPQGAVFGFPNPLLGLMGWVAPIAVGVAMLAGARFARWFWWLFWLGMTFAISLVIWLISQSIFVLGTLCPWCMVTWSVTIPTFFAVSVHMLRTSKNEAAARAGKALMAWVPLATIVAFAIVALLAQLRLDLVNSLIG